MKLAAGVRIRDNLCLESKLGEGAMGEVWRASHEGLGRSVAVKFLHDDAVTGEPRTFERFRREAIAASQIVSPHVVQIFDAAATEDGRPYIVMELLKGESFGECIDSKAPLPLAEVATIVSQVADCIAAAHALGVVHRDIKPDNIFLTHTSSGSLHSKVLDFGIAKVATLADSEVKLTREGNLIGSPAYMSREQIVDTGIVPEQIDLWGLAVCAYEALTGQLPFDGPTVGLVCVAIVQGSFWRPSEHVAELNNEVDAFFARAFAKNPADRFATAQEFATVFASLHNPLRARLAQQDSTSIMALPAQRRDQGKTNPRIGRDLSRAAVADTQALSPRLDMAKALESSLQGNPDADEPAGPAAEAMMLARQNALLESSTRISRQPWTEEVSEAKGSRTRTLGVGLVAGVFSVAVIGFLLSGSSEEASGGAAEQPTASASATSAPAAASGGASKSANPAPPSAPSAKRGEAKAASAPSSSQTPATKTPPARGFKPARQRRLSPEEELGF